MSPLHLHKENHLVSRIGWLRAAVLGANDGIISTASLIVGVAAAATAQHEVLIAGVAGLVAGAMSMAAGEYVSVSSQRDAERADLRREAEELRVNPKGEKAELAGLYVQRGLDAALAEQVATALTAKDALSAHARDELGLNDTTQARPLQAGLASAAAFALGAAPPLMVAALVQPHWTIVAIAAATLIVLAILGALGAQIGGAPIRAAVLRVVFWGALAMLVTAGIGRLLGTTVT